MRWLLMGLLFLFLLLGNAQFLTNNQWQLIRHRHRRRQGPQASPFHLSSSTGIASFQRQGSSISIVLME